jgi:hypothetical protein
MHLDHFERLHCRGWRCAWRGRVPAKSADVAHGNSPDDSTVSGGEGDGGVMFEGGAMADCAQSQRERVRRCVSGGILYYAMDLWMRLS